MIDGTATIRVSTEIREVDIVGRIITTTSGRRYHIGHSKTDAENRLQEIQLRLTQIAALEEGVSRHLWHEPTPGMQ